ncbi:MAG TPA: 2-phospho-L-lactate transferase CofD family protein [bacterium]|nr:2-phospho-L-lactate transferase CofD family protein [bacterium]
MVLAMDLNTMTEGYYWSRVTAAHALRIFSDEVTIRALEETVEYTENPGDSGYIPDPEKTNFMTSPSANPVLNLGISAGMALYEIHKRNARRNILAAGDPTSIRLIIQKSPNSVAAIDACIILLKENRIPDRVKLCVAQALGNAGYNSIKALDVLIDLFEKEEEKSPLKLAYGGAIRSICWTVYVNKIIYSPLPGSLKSELRDLYSSPPSDKNALRRFYDITRGLLGNLHRLGEIKDLKELSAHTEPAPVVVLAGGNSTQGILQAINSLIPEEQVLMVMPVLSTDDVGGSTRNLKALFMHLWGVRLVAPGDIVNCTLKVIPRWMKNCIDQRTSAMREAIHHYRGKTLEQLLTEGDTFLPEDKNEEPIVIKSLDEMKKAAVAAGEEKRFEEFKENVLELARIVDDTFIRSGYLNLYGNSLRNLILIGAILKAGGYDRRVINTAGIYAGLRIYSDLLGVNVYAVSNRSEANAFAGEYESGLVKIEQDMISHTPNAEGNQLKRFSTLYPSVSVPAEEILRIKDAKLIVAGLASFFTSLLVLLADRSVSRAEAENKEGLKILFANAVNDEETAGLSFRELMEMAEQISDRGLEELFDVVVINDSSKLFQQPEFHDKFYQSNYRGPVIPTEDDIEWLKSKGIKVIKDVQFMAAGTKPSRIPNKYDPVLEAIPEELAGIIKRAVEITDKRTIPVAPPPVETSLITRRVVPEKAVKLGPLVKYQNGQLIGIDQLPVGDAGEFERVLNKLLDTEFQELKGRNFDIRFVQGNDRLAVKSGNTIIIDEDALISYALLELEVFGELWHLRRSLRKRGPPSPLERVIDEILESLAKVEYFKSYSSKQQTEVLETLLGDNDIDDKAFNEILFRSLSPAQRHEVLEPLTFGNLLELSPLVGLSMFESYDELINAIIEYARQPGIFPEEMQSCANKVTVKQVVRESDAYQSLLQVFGGNQRELERWIVEGWGEVRFKKSELPFADTVLLGSQKEHENVYLDVPPGPRSWERPESTFIVGGTGGRLLAGTFQRTQIHIMRERGLNILVLVTPFDDGGSSRRLQDALKHILGYFPSPGDTINAFSGFVTPDKRMVIRARFASGEQGSLRDGLTLYLNLVRQLTEPIDISAVGEGKTRTIGIPSVVREGEIQYVFCQVRYDSATQTYEFRGKRETDEGIETETVRAGPLDIKETTVGLSGYEYTIQESEDKVILVPELKLSSDWAYFSNSLLRLADVIDDNFISKGIIFPGGNSIGNLMLIGAMVEGGAYTLDPGEPVNWEKYKESSIKLCDMLGITDGIVFPVSFEPGTLYAKLRAPTIMINDRVLPLEFRDGLRMEEEIDGVEVRLRKDKLTGKIRINIRHEKMEITDEFYKVISYGKHIRSETSRSVVVKEGINLSKEGVCFGQGPVKVSVKEEEGRYVATVITQEEVPSEPSRLRREKVIGETGVKVNRDLSNQTLVITKEGMKIGRIDPSKIGSDSPTKIIYKNIGVYVQKIGEKTLRVRVGRKFAIPDGEFYIDGVRFKKLQNRIVVNMARKRKVRNPETGKEEYEYEKGNSRAEIDLLRNGGAKLRVALDTKGMGTMVRVGGIPVVIYGRLVIEQTNITESPNFSGIVELGFVDGARPKAIPGLVDLVLQTQSAANAGPGSVNTSILPAMLTEIILALVELRKRIPIIFTYNIARDNETVDYTIGSTAKHISRYVSEMAGRKIEFKNIFTHAICNIAPLKTRRIDYLVTHYGATPEMTNELFEEIEKKRVDIKRLIREGASDEEINRARAELTKLEEAELLIFMDEARVAGQKPGRKREVTDFSRAAKQSRGELSVSEREMFRLSGTVFGGVDVREASLSTLQTRELREPGAGKKERGLVYSPATLGTLMENILHAQAVDTRIHDELLNLMPGRTREQKEAELRTRIEDIERRFPGQSKIGVMLMLYEQYVRQAETREVLKKEARLAAPPKIVISDMVPSLTNIDARTKTLLHTNREMAEILNRFLKKDRTRRWIIITGFGKAEIKNYLTDHLDSKVRSQIIIAPCSGAVAYDFDLGGHLIETPLYTHHLEKVAARTSEWDEIVEEAYRIFGLDKQLISLEGKFIDPNPVPFNGRELQISLEMGFRTNLSRTVAGVLIRSVKSKTGFACNFGKRPSVYDLRVPVCQYLNWRFRRSNLPVTAKLGEFGAVDMVIEDIDPADVVRRILGEQIDEGSILIMGNKEISRVFPGSEGWIFAPDVDLPGNVRVWPAPGTVGAQQLLEERLAGRAESSPEPETSGIKKRVPATDTWRLNKPVVLEEGNFDEVLNYLRSLGENKRADNLQRAVNNLLETYPDLSTIRLQLVAGNKELADRMAGILILDYDTLVSVPLIEAELTEELDPSHANPTTVEERALGELRTDLQKVINFHKLNTEQQADMLAALIADEDIDTQEFWKVLIRSYNDREKFKSLIRILKRTTYKVGRYTYRVNQRQLREVKKLQAQQKPIIELVLEYGMKEGVYQKDIRNYIEKKKQWMISHLSGRQRLLVVDSASEISGVGLSKEDLNVVKAIETELEKEIASDGNRHIIEILNIVSDRVGKKAKSAIDELITEVKREDGEFDYGNLAYQAVVSAVRAWPKRHWHAHIGNSIHEGFVWNEMILFNRALLTKFREAVDKMELDAADRRERIALLEDCAQKDMLWHQLPDRAKQVILEVLGLHARTGFSRGDGVYDLASLERAITHVALQHFADGVRDLRVLIGVNSRKFEPDIKKVVKAIIAGFSKAEQLAQEIYGGKFSARLVASFARHSEKNSVANVEEVVNEIIALREESEEYRNRIIGIDFSGAEAIIDARMNTHFSKTSDYKRVIEKARAQGMEAMAHLGDMGHTYRATKELPSRKEYTTDRQKEIADIPGREKRVRKHLEFVEDGITKSGGIGAVLHGTILAPRGSIITKGPKKGYSSAGEAIEDGSNLKKIEELLQYIRDNGIEIQTCPTANTNTQKIAMYRGHPLHQWIIKGNRVSINADDFYWGNVRTTLSDDIAKMMLSAPLHTGITIITPKRAKEISRALTTPVETKPSGKIISPDHFIVKRFFGGLGILLFMNSDVFGAVGEIINSGQHAGLESSFGFPFGLGWGVLACAVAVIGVSAMYRKVSLAGTGIVEVERVRLPQVLGLEAVWQALKSLFEGGQRFVAAIFRKPSRRADLLMSLLGPRQGISEEEIRKTLELARRLVVKKGFEQESPEIIQLLGWTSLPKQMAVETEGIEKLAIMVRRDYERVVVIGEKARLYTEVAADITGESRGYPEISVLESMRPEALKETMESEINPEETLFVVSSAEPVKYLYDKLTKLYKARGISTEEIASQVGKHFVAITETNTPFAEEAREREFLGTFDVPEGISGSSAIFSEGALFVLALAGVDIKGFVESGIRGMEICREENAEENLGVRLAAFQETMRQAGRQIVLVLPEELAEFGEVWRGVISPLGKEGKEIIVIGKEEFAAGREFGKKSAFIRLKVGREKESLAIEELREGGYPVLEISLRGREAIGALFYVGGFATALRYLMRISPTEKGIESSPAKAAGYRSEEIPSGVAASFSLREGEPFSEYKIGRESLGGKVTRVVAVDLSTLVEMDLEEEPTHSMMKRTLRVRPKSMGALKVMKNIIDAAKEEENLKRVNFAFICSEEGVTEEVIEQMLRDLMSACGLSTEDVARIINKKLIIDRETLKKVGGIVGISRTQKKISAEAVFSIITERLLGTTGGNGIKVSIVTDSEDRWQKARQREIMEKTLWIVLNPAEKGEILSTAAGLVVAIEGKVSKWLIEFIEKKYPGRAEELLPQIRKDGMIILPAAPVDKEYLDGIKAQETIYEIQA